MFSAQVKLLLRWSGWFLLVNVGFLGLLGLSYYQHFFPMSFAYFSARGVAGLLLFSVVSYIGYFAVVPAVLMAFLLPIVIFIPQRKLIFSLAAFVFAVAAFFLLLDATVYNLYHFHVNSIFLNFVREGLGIEILGLSPKEIVIAITLATLLVVIEFFLASWVWRYIVLPARAVGWGKWFAIICFTCAYSSFAMIVCSRGGMATTRLLVDFVRFMPFYENFIAWTAQNNGDLISFQRFQEAFVVQPEQVKKSLRYPLQPITCHAKKAPLNVVMIVIDAWRFDELNATVMPNVYRYAQKSWQFSNHYSGGNATGPGIFSIFYSIPATYWTTMLQQQRSPILLDELLAQHYATGIFASASLRLPAFDKTVFHAIKNLNITTLGNTPYARDQKITEEFKQFAATARQQRKPFFSFIFYDAAHTFCAFKDNLQPFQPAVAQCDRYLLNNATNPLPYRNRYRNSLLLIDQQIQSVLQTLQQLNLAANTLVLITGDHGEEFNDTRQNYWGHASNFTQYQVKTPLIMYWPGKQHQVFTQLTSHYDIAPTLLPAVLGCTTPATAYSFGKQLPASGKNPYLVVSSYIALGVIDKTRITAIYPSGDYAIMDKKAQPLPQEKLNVAVLHRVFKDIQRFSQ